MTLREMILEDFDQVLQIESDSFSDPWSREGLFAFWSMKNTLFFSVEQGGEILGYCGLQYVLDEADVLSIAVRRDRRREGIGHFLLDGAMRIAREFGITKIHLEVRQGNEAAIRLYLRCGFVQDGLRKDYYSDPKEDAILMSACEENCGAV